MTKRSANKDGQILVIEDAKKRFHISDDFAFRVYAPVNGFSCGSFYVYRACPKNIAIKAIGSIFSDNLSVSKFIIKLPQVMAGGKRNFFLVCQQVIFIDGADITCTFFEGRHGIHELTPGTVDTFDFITGFYFVYNT